MKIINRTMLSSALLVFLSLTLLLTIISIVLYSLGPEKTEQLDENDFLVGKVIENKATDNEETSSYDWETMDNKISRYGYGLLVLENQEVTFPPSPNHDMIQNAEALKTIPLSVDILFGEKDGLVIIAAKAGAYSLFAVKDTSELTDENIFTEFLLPFWTVCFIAIIIILILSQFFTRKLARHILNPLNSLLKGAKRIENGDLSQPIDYSGNDEFAPVCTAFNHMQEHLLKELAKNAAYEQARIDLVTGISHDLRTPLTSIKGYIKGLRDGVANTPDKHEHYLDVAYQKTCHMEVLLEKLFDFSSLEVGGLPICMREDDLGDFVQNFVNEIQDELAQNGILIQAEITPVPHPVEIDAAQIRRILMNLVDNAVRYAGTDKLSLRLHVYRKCGFEYLVFNDNGKGVPEEELPFIFERFWRGDEARNSNGGIGNGLGLFIVKYIVQIHRGTVTAANQGGLKIDIALPWRKETQHE